MGCADHARCPAACGGVGGGFASFLWLQWKKCPELSPAGTDVSQNTNIPVCPQPEAACWTPGSLGCFFTGIYSTPEPGPFPVGRSNPAVAKDLGLVPDCH